MINRDLKTWCAANVRARLKKIWPKRKRFTYKALVAFKKKIKTFYHFTRLNLYFPDFFSGLENCWANVKTFLRLCTNPVHLWESALESKTRTTYGVTAGMAICCPSGERKLTVNQVVKIIVTYKPQKIAYHSIYFTLDLK